MCFTPPLFLVCFCVRIFRTSLMKNTKYSSACFEKAHVFDWRTLCVLRCELKIRTAAALNHNNTTKQEPVTQENFVLLTVAISQHLYKHDGLFGAVTQKARTWIYKHENNQKNSLSVNRYIHYPCLCLCFGFSQITLTLPFLLMTLHFSQIGFTDDLTFTVIPSFQKSPLTSIT